MIEFKEKQPERLTDVDVVLGGSTCGSVKVHRIEDGRVTYHAAIQTTGSRLDDRCDCLIQGFGNSYTEAVADAIRDARKRYERAVKCLAEFECKSGIKID